MPDYQNGKIYKIVHPECDKPYIGSTTLPLYKRLSHHRYNTKHNINRCNSKHLFQTEGATIELVELFPCENSTQLLRREGEIIRSMPCINKQISGRTLAEYKQENREKLLEDGAKYRAKHKERISEYLKTKHTCECGGKYTNRDRAKHMRTKKHLQHIETSQAPPI